jgi:hypothetical protein
MRIYWLRFGPARRVTTWLAVVTLVAVAPGLIESKAAQATRSVEPLDVTAVRAAALAKHNTLRKSHGSPAMTLSAALNNTAQAWAEQIAASGSFAHSSPDQRNGAGENIYASFTGEALVPEALSDAAVQSWYDEVKDYDFGDPALAGGTLHFTQVVWKSSTKLGVGAAQGIKTIDGEEYDALYVVCQYSPAGNIQGRLSENVQANPGTGTQPPAAGTAHTRPSAGAQPPADRPATPPQIMDVTFKEMPVDGQKVGTLILFSTQITGTLSVEVNGRQIAPPLEAMLKPDKGFVRLKGSRRELNVVKGANTVVYIVDGLRSAPMRFTF